MNKQHALKQIALFALAVLATACSEQPMGVAQNPIRTVHAATTVVESPEPILLAPEAYALPPSAMQNTVNPTEPEDASHALPCLSVGACSN